MCGSHRLKCIFIARARRFHFICRNRAISVMPNSSESPTQRKTMISQQLIMMKARFLLILHSCYMQQELNYHFIQFWARQYIELNSLGMIEYVRNRCGGLEQTIEPQRNGQSKKKPRTLYSNVQASTSSEQCRNEKFQSR